MVAPPKPMSRADWLRTPYAKSSASDPDKAVRDLLVKRGVVDIQHTETTGPNGRRAYSVRFRLHDKIYRVGMEVLHAAAAPDELLKQAKRAVFHLLKSVLEFATVFAPLEQVLFAYLETPAGPTLYEVARPQLGQLQAVNFTQMFALPPARGAE